MQVEMNTEICGSKGWIPAEKRTFECISRWIKVKHNYNPGKRNPLWDYVQDEMGYHPGNGRFNPANGLYLDYFTFKGRNYAIEQFLALGNPFWMPVIYSYEDKEGKLHFLSAVDGDTMFDPLYIECDEYVENLRVWRAV